MNTTDYPAARRFHAETSYIADSLPGTGVLQSGIKTFKEYLHCPRVELPVPAIPDSNLHDVLFGRHSSRKFKNQPVPLITVVNILFAGYGVLKKIIVGEDEYTARTIPSAGALYPLEFYILALRVDGLAPGIYHYLPQTSQLEFIYHEPVQAQLVNRLFLQQSWIHEAGVIVFATAVLQRTLCKYLDRGYRYILLEAGHAFQNMNLMASACNLSAVNIGAFFDEEIGTLLQITPGEEVPIYATILGVKDDDL